MTMSDLYIVTVEDAQDGTFFEDPEGFEKKGYTAEFCLQQLDKIRAQTRESLASFKDKDLERQ